MKKFVIILAAILVCIPLSATTGSRFGMSNVTALFQSIYFEGEIKPAPPEATYYKSQVTKIYELAHGLERDGLQKGGENVVEIDQMTVVAERSEIVTQAKYGNFQTLELGKRFVVHEGTHPIPITKPGSLDTLLTGGMWRRASSGLDIHAVPTYIEVYIHAAELNQTTQEKLRQYLKERRIFSATVQIDYLSLEPLSKEFRMLDIDNGFAPHIMLALHLITLN